MEFLTLIKITTFIFISLQLKLLFAMHFHHSDYQVHHKMGKMKIKVKPEGAKLIFTGGDLGVHLHPAHGYVRPVHNIIVSHDHHGDHYEGIHHHDIEYEEEEHSGHHDWHHSYHHDEHGGHDDEGYGFRHFHHWPNSLDGEHSFLGHDFYDDHHGDHHGHFRDEINDSDSNNDDDDGAIHRPGESRHNIIGGNVSGRKSSENDESGPRENQGFQRSFDKARNDAVIFGKKIYPDDAVVPTFKSRIEENFEKISSKIAPRLLRQKEETEEGSGRGTISPFDDENDSQDDKMNESRNLRSQDENAEDRNEERGGKFDESKQNINIKELERIAKNMKPDIPSDENDLPIKESSSNTKDIGSPSQVYVNMSGEPHNYEDERRQYDYPAPNRSFRPDLADNDNERHFGTYYPNEEENWSRPHDDNDDESEGYKKSLAEFQKHSQKISEISNEGGMRKDSNPPVVVHPDGDPLNGNAERAFYEFHPTKYLSQHLATISDFNVRSKIDRNSRGSDNRHSNQKHRSKRRSLIADRLIQRLRRS